MTQAHAHDHADAHAHAQNGRLADVRPGLRLHIGSDEPLGARRNRLLACLPEPIWQRWHA